MKLNHSQYILIFLTLIASGYVLVAIGKWWLADKTFAHGKGLADAGYVSDALPKLQTAIKLMPREPLFHDGLSDTATKIAFGLSQQQATDSARQAAELAIAESNLTLKLNPVHLNFWKTRIRMWLILAQLDPNLYTQALGDLQHALSLHPTDAKLMYNLGALQLELKQVETARQTLQATLDLKPDYAAARQALDQLKSNY